MTGYYEAFNNPNVSLVDLGQTPIVRVTERGIETADGEREFDIIVWATGFDFGTGALPRMGIRGRNGLALEDHWADGPRTFLGVQTAGFPNFFFPGGPHAAAGNNPRYNGDQVDFITDTLVYAARPRLRHDRGRPRGRGASGPTWSTPRGEVAAASAQSSYFFGTNIPGKPRQYLLNSAGRPKLFAMIAEVRDNDYTAFTLSRRGSAGSPPLPATAAGAR